MVLSKGVLRKNILSRSYPEEKPKGLLEILDKSLEMNEFQDLSGHDLTQAG